MRFSLKWILAAMGCVALVVAAFSQQSWVYADLPRLVALAAVAYVMLAAGFEGVSTAQVSAVVPAPAAVTAQSYSAAPTFVDPASVPPTATRIINYAVASYGSLFAFKLRAANVVGTTPFELLGCTLGALAYRRLQADVVMAEAPILSEKCPPPTSARHRRLNA